MTELATQNIEASPVPATLGFVLPPTMTVENAEALAAELKQLPLAEKTCLTLDAAGVQTITTPGLQLIAALQKTLADQGGTLSITGQPEHFIRAFKDTGLESVLGQSS